jgi:2-(3-amino-3-carboxypropyl)histidine synthase
MRPESQAGAPQQLPYIAPQQQASVSISQLPNLCGTQIHKTVARIQQLGACRVALQFPEGLLMYACVIADILER